MCLAGGAYPERGQIDCGVTTTNSRNKTSLGPMDAKEVLFLATFFQKVRLWKKEAGVLLVSA